MEHSENQITVRGSLLEFPCFSHENHRRRFYRFTLQVPRLSGTEDLLPVVAEEGVLQQLDLSGGSMLRVTGQVRTHNVRQDGVRRLLIFIFAADITAEEGEPTNEAQLLGTLCRDASYRHTPLGREICDVMLAVPRAFGRADYLPCILWGRIARQCAACRTGDILQLSGRLQSRLYTKLEGQQRLTRTAYEISALTAQALPREQ